MNISRDKRIIDLTIGEFEDYLRSIGFTPQPAKPEKHYVYGISGIMDLFGVSESTARRLKNGKINGAVSQNNRTIVVDAEKAMELFHKNTQRNGI